MCKGALEDSRSTFMTDLGSCIVIVKNVPSQVCAQCGEVSYSDEVARQLEHILSSLTQTVHTEIAVVDYRSQAA
jgi:YgiT-type zinc finger domain-containing protein